MEPLDLPETSLLLQKNWGLTPPGQLDWETLREALRVQLRSMLGGNLEVLVQTMYRLDVNESKFQGALALPNLEERAVALATIVLDRELQRLETWRKYSSRG